MGTEEKRSSKRSISPTVKLTEGRENESAAAAGASAASSGIRRGGARSGSGRPSGSQNSSCRSGKHGSGIERQLRPAWTARWATKQVQSSEGLSRMQEAAKRASSLEEADVYQSKIFSSVVINKPNTVSYAGAVGSQSVIMCAWRH